MSPEIYKVTSPLMGTFYRASAPGENPLVEVGQKVKVSDVVCVIESMKIFTELRADQEGTVKNILVDDEEPVMKNQELIEIEID
ncbi:MAG: biotin carboxyl carrier domain-containing protein [Deltaproteobacteria bacterium]|nr:biotin carboxyl carrier domain-containing protein [Deltaproteobacteria bacterium]NNK85945.1 biotin carboxyl carrier domain-containing protein [Desulfobacterales bacterium]